MNKYTTYLDNDAKSRVIRNMHKYNNSYSATINELVKLKKSKLDKFLIFMGAVFSVMLAYEFIVGFVSGLLK